MTTVDLIPALFDEVAEQLGALPPHPDAPLWPRAVGTWGLLQALQGVGHRAFDRWVRRDSRALCPGWPERTRLLRLCTPHQDGTTACVAAPTGLGGIDTSGIAWIQPLRAGRSPQPIGRQGVSPQRWMVGGTRWLRLTPWGLSVGWACASAHVAANPLQGLVRQFAERMMVVSDTGFQAAAGAPANLQLGQRGAWQERLLVETVRSLRTLVCPCKQMMHRGWAYFQARLAFPMAAFNVLVQWHGFEPYASGFVPLAMAEFSL